MFDKKKPTQYQKRLLDQIQSVEDDTLRDFISECVFLEFAHRSECNFPVRKLRQLVDAYADLSEGEEQ